MSSRRDDGRFPSDIADNMKVAVRGTGSIGMRHITVLSEMGVETIAVPVRSTRLGELRSKGIHCAETMLEAVESGCSAVIIATDTGRHVADVLGALNLGMNVLVEKPLAISTADARAIVDYQGDGPGKLLVAYCLRFHAGMKLLKEHLNEAGRFHSVRIECRSYLPGWRPDRDYKKSYSAREIEGGVLRDMSHEVDYALWLFGEPEALWGRLANDGILGISAEEAADAFWTTPKGVRVSVELDYLSRIPSRFVRVSGDSGELKLDFIKNKITFSGQNTTAWTEKVAEDSSSMYKRQAEAFLQAVSGGGAGNLATLEESMAVLRVCDAWRASSRSRNIERVQ